MSHDLARLCAACTNALGALRMGPLFGLDLEATIGEADTVVLADLPNNDKVQAVGNTIYLLKSPIEDIARCHISAEEARARAILYFVHELAHLPQGIGDYASVVALRAISEEALLRLDLAADHVAALAYQRITGAPLTAIKAMQARGLDHFPVTDRHSHSGKLRKAWRRASVEADIHLARPEGHALVLFAAEGGPRVHLWVGEGPDQLLGVAPARACALAA
jgi:hypothetical protein